MTLQIRINNQRLSIKGSSRHMLSSIEVPKSPTSRGLVCGALKPDGSQCTIALTEMTDIWCDGHQQEWKDLDARWREIYSEAEKQTVISLKTAKWKAMKLRLSVDLRRQIRDRFYPEGGDLYYYINWIAKLETELRQLAENLLMQNLDHTPSPETPLPSTPHSGAFDLEKIMILQSPLDPKIPIASFQEIPDSSTILVLKHFYIDLCADSIRRLYTIAPDLYDYPKRPESLISVSLSAPDTGTDIVRQWFRIMVLNDSDAATLEHATRAKSIDEFLKGCQASQLEMYCDFFDNAWRPHAVQYLRLAICAQTLAGGDIKMMQLLGGTVPCTTAGLKMTKPSWDILYRWFPTLLTPTTLASICSNFDDYTTICKLLMLSLYREHWHDPKSIMSECTTGVYMGFVPTRKGDFSAHVGLRNEGELWIQRQSRNYLCGQMAMGDPLTKAFLDEMLSRRERLHLVVYEGTNGAATVRPEEPDLFICRHRAAMTNDELHTMEWNTTLSLEDVKDQLRRGQTAMYDPIVVDSWQFTLIDREVGLPFQLIDIVEDAMLMLCGDPSPRQVAKRVIRETVPPSAQDIFLDQITIESSHYLSYPAPIDVQYEGNRWRSYCPDRSVVAINQRRMALEQYSRDTNRLIRRISEDMERCGIITLSCEYESPQARPIVVQGEDGAYDLYFSYRRDTSTKHKRSHSLPLPPMTCLLDFAQSWKKKHPNGIVAKGSIHTHYCAWPMPAIKSLGRKGLNFVTWEGHVYHWNAMPFDRPSSANAWQFYIQHYMSKFPWITFYLTTFAICATDIDDAERKSAELLQEMEDRGWKITLPKPHEWREDVDELKLDIFF